MSEDYTAAMACALILAQRLPFERMRSRKRRRRKYLLAVLAASEADPKKYSLLNRSSPILRLYFDVEKDMRPHFKLSRETMQALFKLLRKCKEHGWAPQMEILVFLFWLAHGLSYRITAQSFDMPKSTIHRMVHSIALTIQQHIKHFIHYPAPQDLKATGLGFGQLTRSAAFDHAVGSIDVCHIRIKPPLHCTDEWLNEKMYHSVQLQAVCDSDGRFLNVFVGYPGSIHKSQVLRDSPIYARREYPPEGFFLLGDGHYPCISAPLGLVTPFHMPLQNPAQQWRYNKCHARGRAIVEHTFRRMKTRWRRTLFHATDVSASFIPLVVFACCALHNLCLANGDTSDLEEEDLEPPRDEPHQPESHSIVGACDGTSLRNRLVEQVLLPEHLADHEYF